ncbi:C-type lectin domain family 4 member M-like [Boleophthalmus pectinirostris]|uniref:C-type lectin domain family 4 member M-like n=1 Tax=Boleophthalmus pectinirostris TaxID=150288 RepID=UPI00242D31E3|nr:C-type lectin domain family 4 member M-like [Boleophthalmus pectinirostris]
MDIQVRYFITNLTGERDVLQEKNLNLETSNHNLSLQVKLLEEDVRTLHGDRNKLRNELQELEEKQAELRCLVENRCCPKNWIRFGSSCFLVSPNTKTWTESRQECEELRATLVIISSPEQQRFVSGLTRHTVWMGLTDAHTEGEWRWVNGDAVTSSFWGRGEPNNAGDEDCGEISAQNLWNDAPCRTKQHFICQKVLQL